MAERNAPKLETFGCRLNIWESEVMREQAGVAGFNDAIIFNTCAVTSEAERQARQAIRRARRENPDAKIVVTGCAAQITPEAWAAMPEVDHVMGNAEKLDARKWQALADGTAGDLVVSDIMALNETAPHMVDSLPCHCSYKLYPKAEAEGSLCILTKRPATAQTTNSSHTLLSVGSVLATLRA